MPTPISVIIPAYNAAATLKGTIESLLAQTVPYWEAIIVDDGSHDQTAAIAMQLAAGDQRIRAVSQVNQGVSVARNAGLEMARHDWVLFLDADDALAPTYVEKMTAPLLTQPAVDAVICGWAKIASEGIPIQEVRHYDAATLFAELSYRCAFAVHACIARTQLIKAIGGFDPSLRSCEDWDLWQRLARSGAAFAVVEAVLAYYHVQPNSLSSQSHQLLMDALQVIARGHTADPRVQKPHPSYAQGQPLQQLPKARLQWLSWAAGLRLGAGGDALPLLALLPNDRAPALDPHTVAYNIFHGVVLPNSQPLTAWSALWQVLELKLLNFLSALEAQSMAKGFAKRTQVILQHLVWEYWQGALPAEIGTAYLTKIEVTAPLPDFSVGCHIERFYSHIELEGTRLGSLELPVCDGWVPQTVLADAIAANFAWVILERFLEHTVYSLQPSDRHQTVSEHHHQMGWLTFLRDLWGMPQAAQGRFYSPMFFEFPGLSQRIIYPEVSSKLQIEVSEALPTIVINAPALDVVPTVGGVALGMVTVPVTHGIISAQALRTAVTQASGFELCRVCVREGLLGQALYAPGSLRSRLAKQANNRNNDPAHDVTTTSVSLAQRSQPLGSSASRRATLPKHALPDLLAMAQQTSEPIVYASNAAIERVAYAPGLIGDESATSEKRLVMPPIAPGLGIRSRIFMQSLSAPMRAYLDRAYDAFSRRFQHSESQAATSTSTKVPDLRFQFENLFATQPNSWEYTSPYGQKPIRQQASQAVSQAGDRGGKHSIVTHHLPILMYHRIAPDGAASMSPWRVTPVAFEAQLNYLRDAGFYSATWEDWRLASSTRTPLPGRAILLTFDDGYLDFLTNAYPLLKQYGFSATVFLVTDRVGQTNVWDEAYGEALPLLNWEQIRYLQANGIEFGSHTATHPPLTALSITEVVQEAARSRAILTKELGQRVSSFAYPYGDRDPAIEHLMGACGYLYAVTCRGGTSHFGDSMLSLPRLLIDGNDRLNDFITKLN